ncbi:unnamed protein product [Cuscuta campestris]|uniref:Uncharacterized protein n=1 Tax=Cuscuta campestris TaxID=132261 RepID=A0A484MK88_9ASTE|nr:unnamed protein product [Cuscuta campestris]
MSHRISGSCTARERPGHAWFIWMKNAPRILTWLPAFSSLMSLMIFSAGEEFEPLRPRLSLASMRWLNTSMTCQVYMDRFHLDTLMPCLILPVLGDLMLQLQSLLQ